MARGNRFSVATSVTPPGTATTEYTLVNNTDIRSLTGQTSKAVSGLTKANPGVFTTAAHGLTVGQRYQVEVSGITGWAVVDPNGTHFVTVASSTTLTATSLDTSSESGTYVFTSASMVAIGEPAGLACVTAVEIFQNTNTSLEIGWNDEGRTDFTRLKKISTSGATWQMYLGEAGAAGPKGYDLTYKVVTGGSPTEVQVIVVGETRREE